MRDSVGFVLAVWAMVDLCDSLIDHVNGRLFVPGVDEPEPCMVHPVHQVEGVVACDGESRVDSLGLERSDY